MRLSSLRWLAAAGLVAAGVKVYLAGPELADWFHRHRFRVDGLDQAVPSQVYFLETNRWLAFDIPHGSLQVRLISNASLPEGAAAATGAQWPYAIEYHFEGADGAAGARGVYHFRGEQLLYADRQTSAPAEVNSYLDRYASPLGGRRCSLNLRDPARTNAHVLKLRLHSSHPDLLEVAVRVYFQQEVSERKLAYRWDRLSDNQKRDLNRGNVYPPDGLSVPEKRGLLRYKWLVASPEGIPGRDFHRRTLFIRDDSESLRLIEPWDPAGLPVDAQHFGVLPFTNAPGSRELQMIDHAPGPSDAISSTLLWQDDASRGRRTNALSWSGTNTTLLPAEGGLLEVSASRRVYLRAFQVEDGKPREITPEPAQLTAFQVTPAQPLDYVIHHVENDPTFFRIDLRRAAGPGAPGGLARFELRGEDSVLDAGDVTLTNVVSPFDWLVTTNGLADVTLAQSLCFVLPPNVRGVKIIAPAETLYVNAYSRPSQLIKRINAPDDYSPARRLSPEQPSWFTVRPPDHAARRQNGQTTPIRVQARPPEIDEQIEAGLYEWEPFLPEPQPVGQMVLFPTEPGQPLRPDTRPFTYYPVAAGQTRLRFEGQPGDREIAPTLLVVFPDGLPGSASVSVDGRTILEQRLETDASALRLGNLPVGDHTLGLTANRPALAFANFIEPGTNAPSLQRFCVTASSNTLHFPYVKRQAGIELLVLRVFSPAAAHEPFKVRVALKPGVPRGIGPFPELTFFEREATITPNASARSYLIAASPGRLDDGQCVLIPVGSDVAPGRHQLDVTVQAESPRWLSLSRTTPGVAEKLQILSKHRAD